MCKYIINLNKHEWIKIKQLHSNELYYSLIVYNFFYHLGFPLIEDP